MKLTNCQFSNPATLPVDSYGNLRVATVPRHVARRGKWADILRNAAIGNGLQRTHYTDTVTLYADDLLPTVPGKKWATVKVS